MQQRYGNRRAVCRACLGRLIGACLLMSLSTGVRAEVEPPPDVGESMSRQIDRRIEARLSAEGMEWSEPCRDEEFLRRVSLDLTGVIPTVNEVRAFLAETAPDKRKRLVDRLLSSPRHATHLATTWRTILIPNDIEAAQRGQAAALQRWLREQFVSNLRYDRIVAEFLSATGDQQAGPALFYRALEARPEKLASATSRIFLGLQIECAECHDHPFDHWSQRDFWGYAAFFAELQQNSSMRGGEYLIIDVPGGEVTLPESDEVITPRFPTGDTPSVKVRGSRRRQLAIWMASRDNPFLAQATVNRVWSQMFGRGLVNPIDDLGKHNPASHPDLFSELSQYFVKQEFDLRTLYRALALTDAYQRSSAADQTDDRALSLYAIASVKRLSPEQLFDSLHRSLHLAGGVPDADDPTRRNFVAEMNSSSRDLTEYNLGMQQVLRMMNGLRIDAVTRNDDQGILASLGAPFFNDSQRIEVLFLATLSRYPTNSEQSWCIGHLEGADSWQSACGDILWALLNSAEYQFNF